MFPIKSHKPTIFPGDQNAIGSIKVPPGAGAGATHTATAAMAATAAAATAATRGARGAGWYFLMGFNNMEIYGNSE